MVTLSLVCGACVLAAWSAAIAYRSGRKNFARCVRAHQAEGVSCERAVAYEEAVTVGQIPPATR